MIHRKTVNLFLIMIIGVGFLLSESETTIAKSLDQKSGRQLISRQLPSKPSTTNISDNAPSGMVVLKFKDTDQVKLIDNQLLSKKGVDVSSAESILTSYLSTNMKRLFKSIDESELDSKRKVLQEISGYALADLNSYYRVEVSTPSEAQQLINSLNALDEIEIAYYQPAPEPAGDIDPPTPNYQPSQDYREAAPAGVDADFANTQPGGDGTGVKIIDIEGNWQTTHEDLEKAVGQIITPSVINDLSWRNHGTAVIGEMIGGDNGYGVTGICPGADIGMVSIATISTAEALYTSIANLQPGDMILIELHAPGPHFNFESRDDQLGYVAMEYWQANFDAIQYAWANGITVIEAAGNGAENYDDVGIYGQLFDTTYRNSHAIMVGAGWPAASANDRIRHGFSNYGERVNLQGYGSGVYTTGYGGLFAPNGDENQFYTSSFSGTSSASPIVTGAAACLQGHFKATYGTYMTSDMIRDLLYATGSPQLGNTSQHIGPRPDLNAAFAIMPAPMSLYTNPLFIDTSLTENDIINIPVWLINRSTSNQNFTVISNDSLARRLIPDWLQTTPSTGTVLADDSIQLSIQIDATVLGTSLEQFKGVVEIEWNTAPNDTTIFLPVFLDIPCTADTNYTAVSSDDGGDVIYDWVDATTLGNKIQEADLFNSFGGDPLDDGTTVRQAIGFSFPFFGTDYDSVSIGVNGGVSFTETEVNVNGFFSSLSFPGAPFSTILAPFYADLIINTSAAADAGIYIYRSSGNDSLVIQWHNIDNFNSPGSLADFQVILTGDGRIKYQYQNIESSGLQFGSLVGLQEIDCKSYQYFRNGQPSENLISNSEAVQFRNTSQTCCVGFTGNVECDPADQIDISDITRLIDFLFISGDPLCCFGEADLTNDLQVDIADLTDLIDYLFISGTAPEFCQ